MSTLLEAISIVLETHFRFGFRNESPIGDSLRGDGRIMCFLLAAHISLSIFLEAMHLDTHYI